MAYPQTLELAEWKLSSAIGLIRYAACDDEMGLTEKELWGLCSILHEVKEIISAKIGGENNVTPGT